MPAVHETAYPRLKSNFSKRELDEVFTATAEELAFSKEASKGDRGRTLFLILLKCFQRLGYFPFLQEIPTAIVTYLLRQTKTSVDNDVLIEYDQSPTRRRHIAIIRKYCGVVGFSASAKEALARAVVEAARTKEDVADIINVGIEELVRLRFELPAFSTLHRAAKAARSTVNRGFYSRVAEGLSDTNRKTIEDLFQVPDSGIKSPWDDLKREPGRPSRDHFKELLSHLEKLCSLPISEESLSFLPAVKRKQFALEARSLDAPRMQRLGTNKRLTLACCLILVHRAKCLDDLGEMFIKRMMKIHNNGQEALNRYQQETRETTDDLLTKFHGVLSAFQSEGTDETRFKAIAEAIGGEPGALLEKVSTQIAYAGNNYFYFLWSYYKNYRSLLFELIESVSLVSTTQDSSLEIVIAFLKEHKLFRAEWIECPKDLPLSWVPEKWRKLIGETHKDGKRLLNRRHFEVCIFSQITWELKSGDLAIPGSEQYSDYRNQLISWEEYDSAIENYGQVAGIQVVPAEFIKSLKEKLVSLAKSVDKAFPENESIRIENSEPILRRLIKKGESQRLKTLERLISQAMPPMSIMDILVDTEHWLNWTKIFGPVSGFDSKIEEAAARYVITAFCYGCNLGPTQTARSIKNIDRRQIAWINQRHITEAKLQEAITAVINAYNLFPLPKLWGSGKSASADGTRWNLYEQNLLSEYHIRYGGYGGIGYYHVSDTYIALFSHFIPCGVWEAVYILDGLLKNKSDIQPDTLHADTQGQSAPVFALSHLLGIKLMPRIRNWKDMTLFRPEKNFFLKHIDGLFSVDIVDWKLIETHFRDMMRVVLSIKQGKITASTILRRLGTFSRKNRLYFAFRELGRAIRTGFLLEYISNQELRSTIQSATNKSEAFNGFTKWVFFGGEGIIAENNRDEQRKIIKYNHLVSTLLIFHTVYSLTRVLSRLEKEGQKPDDRELSMISPYLTEHINRFGNYTLNLKRKTPPLGLAIQKSGNPLPERHSGL